MSYVKVPVKVKDKKVENKKSQKKAADEVALNNDLLSELRAPRWSVVTFETCAASNLTYEEAAQKLAELQARKTSGLCIITDEAAEKILLKSK